MGLSHLVMGRGECGVILYLPDIGQGEVAKALCDTRSNGLITELEK